MKLKKILNEQENKIQVLSYLKNTLDPIVVQNYNRNTMSITVKLSNGKNFEISLQNPLTSEQQKLLKGNPKSFFMDLGHFEVHSVIDKSFI